MGLLSRLVVKCVRSTTSLAVTMDLALGQVILLLVVSSLVGANSETFRGSSTGDAARIQGSKMGDYLPTSYSAIQGHPVYEKTNGHKNFLYVSPNGFWTVGSVRGSTVSGIYNSQFPTPSLPPTSGWRYLDGKEWKEDTTLKVERKTASPAGVAAVDQSVLGRNLLQRQLLERQLLERQALERQLLAQTAPRTLPSTAAVVPAPRAAPNTTAAQTTAPAAGCPFRIEVRITSTDGSPTNTDDDQPANRYAGLGVRPTSGVRPSVPTQDYRGAYTRSLQQDANGFPIYTKNGNPAITISRVTTAAGTQWQMNGGRSGTAANTIQGITVPTGTPAGRTCSLANPPAASGTTTVLCNLYGPHLIANSNAACPHNLSSWSFKVGPTAASAAAAGTAIFKRANNEQISVTALP